MAAKMASKSKIHFRSISLPSRSHPSTAKIEEEITRIKALDGSFESTSGGICSGLSGLEELYLSMDDLLTMASTQQVLSKNQDEQCVDELLDASVRILDVCGIARDIMLQIKEQVFAVQSAIRRRKGNSSSVESSIVDFNSFRKKTKKVARKLIAALKQTEIKNAASTIQNQDPHFLAVIRVLREINAINISIFQSLFTFLASPSSTKQATWSMVSKLMHKGVVVENEQENVNEFEAVDAAISQCSSNVEKIQSAQKKLEDLESSIQGIENGLERVFRRLIKARATLLNIISQ